MAPTDTSEERGTLGGNDRLEAREIMERVARVAAETDAKVRETLSSAMTASQSALYGGGGYVATLVPPENSASAENALLQDIDAILSRLDAGIAREREAMDKLVERIRQPAA